VAIWWRQVGVTLLHLLQTSQAYREQPEQHITRIVFVLSNSGLASPQKLHRWVQNLQKPRAPIFAACTAFWTGGQRKQVACKSNNDVVARATPEQLFHIPSTRTFLIYFL
jgi:hypothetical protein